MIGGCDLFWAEDPLPVPASCLEPVPPPVTRRAPAAVVVDDGAGPAIPVQARSTMQTRSAITLLNRAPRRLR